MPKGGHRSRGRGNRGSPRGRDGGGRGSGRFGGRGRGGPTILDAEIDFNLQAYNYIQSDGVSGRGRGFGQPTSSNSRSETPTRRGFSQLGRGRGRGRGGIQGGSRLRPDGPLSELLYQERPLLRPIKFVPSVHTKTLFTEVEEILKPVVEDIDPTDNWKSHVPTGDRVARVFSGGNFFPADSSSSDDDQENLQEIDFNDIDKLLDIPAQGEDVRITEERFTGFRVDTNIGTQAHIEGGHPSNTSTEMSIVQRKLDSVSINTDDISTKELQPVNHKPGDSLQSAPNQHFYYDSNPSSTLLPAVSPHHDLPDLSDEEIIVYVAPHPRNSTQPPQIPLSREDKSRYSPYVRSSFLPALPSQAPDDETTEMETTTHEPVASSSKTVSQNVPPVPSFNSVSFTSISRSATNTPVSVTRKRPPIFTPRTAKVASAWERKRNRRAKGSFRTFGAMREEVMLRRGKVKDPRWAERRRGDSDLDWGDSGGEMQKDLNAEKESTGQTSNGSTKRAVEAHGAEGMDVDPELELDIEAMKRFVGGLVGKDAGTHVTMGDISDADKLTREDEEAEMSRGSSGDSDGEEGEGEEERGEEEGDDGDDDDDNEDEVEDGEIEAVFEAEEVALVAEPGRSADVLNLDLEDGEIDGPSDEDDSSDEGQTPRTKFRARLEALRTMSQKKKARDDSFNSDMNGEDEDEDDDDDLFERYMTMADKDEEFIAQIDDIVHENGELWDGSSRKERKMFFNSPRDDYLDDVDYTKPATKRKNKGKGLPLDLQIQWEKDRQKKAARRRDREIERLIQATDPLSRKKGGKKGRKTMLTASRLDPTITVIPNRIIDMTTLVQQIRRFISDLRGPSSMALPPTNKETRANVHQMALAFGLKSVSKGYGDARYTTLMKTSRTGNRVDEAKVAKIVRRTGAGSGRDAAFVDRKAGGPKYVLPRHRDGEEVGKTAPKIGESNIGFQMLASMGWTEGDRIGVTGGLDAPLKAIYKTTKLGLGATK